MLPSPWGVRPSSPASSTSSASTFIPPSPHLPTSPSYHTVVAGKRPVQVHSEYRKGGARPQSQAALVVLGGEPLGQAGLGAVIHDAPEDDDDAPERSSRYSLYTRIEIKKLDKDLLLWMSRLTTTPNSSTEDLTSTTPPLSPSTPSNSSPLPSISRNLSPSDPMRNHGAFAEDFTRMRPPSSAPPPSTAPSSPRTLNAMKRWWKSSSTLTRTTTRSSSSSSSIDSGREGSRGRLRRTATRDDWEIVSSSTPEEWQGASGEAIDAGYATFTPSPRVRPRSKSLAGMVKRKKKGEKGKRRAVTEA